MILFISDLHLDASRPQITQAFYQFLQHRAVQADALYILGDFFELWVGDDDDDPFVLEVQAQLKIASDTGLPIYFMHGNRDFLIGNTFAERSGVQLLKDPAVLQLGDTTTLLSHGDQFCTLDAAYQAFRQQTRMPEWQAAVLCKPLAERREIGRQLRAQSKTMSSRNAIDIMDVSESAVWDALIEHQATLLIHGHTHRPNRHQYTHQGIALERIVLGDWEDLGWCLRYDGDFFLESWPIT